MALLLRARFIALDSAQLGDWSRDRTSNDTDRNSKASQFEAHIAESGLVPLICWHHLEELLRTENIAAGQTHVSFLRQLPLVAWIRSRHGESGFGSVLDILNAEATVVSKYDCSAVEVRNEVTPSLFQIGSGIEALAPYSYHWQELRTLIWERAEREREIVAIGTSNVFGNGSARIYDLMKGSIRSPQEVHGQFQKMHRELSQSISARGDPRIEDADSVSQSFFIDAIQTGLPHASDANSLVMHGLSVMGIDLDEIDENTTVDDIGELFLFRKRLEIATRNTPIDWRTLKRAERMAQFPSWNIDQSLRRFGQRLPRQSGSELTDRYLACLAPYADVTFVDKRTHENFRRASSKSEIFSSLLRTIAKTSSYQTAFEHL